jgi:germination protein M
MRPAHTRVQTVLRAALVVLMLVAVFALSSACARDTAPDEPESPSPSQPSHQSPRSPKARPRSPSTSFAGETLGVAVREVPETVAVARAALEELLAGPTAQRPRSGLATEIPEGTRLNDVAVADGVATVDLSPEFESGGGSLSMQLRVAQVVYTLTRFPSVESVAFMIDGQPVEAIGGEG